MACSVIADQRLSSLGSNVPFQEEISQRSPSPCETPVAQVAVDVLQRPSESDSPVQLRSSQDAKATASDIHLPRSQESNQQAKDIMINGPSRNDQEKTSPAPSGRTVGQEALAPIQRSLDKDNRESEQEVKAESAAGEKKGASEFASTPVPEISAEEKLFVAKRKEILLKRLEEWKVGYEPYPMWILSFCPPIVRIVKKESLAALDTFTEKLKRAPTRLKMASIMSKNAAIMKESTFCMNAATEKKMLDACTLIEEEIKALGDLPHEALLSEPKKTVPTVLAQDPLYTEKTRILKKLEDWKIDFKPYPHKLLTGSEEVIATVAKKAHRLFHDLYKGIVRAPSKNALIKCMDDSSSLMTDYSYFVNTDTETKLTAACAILAAEKKELENIAPEKKELETVAS